MAADAKTTPHPVPWKRKSPKSGEHQHLSAEAKAAARRRAEAAGRKYPNLIDNMWAAKEFRK